MFTRFNEMRRDLIGCGCIPVPSANVFICYAFDVLGEDVYKVCEEIFVENGWMNR